MGPFRPRIMAVDLTDERSRKAFLIFLEEAELVPDILVNNAGIGAAGEYADAPWEKLDTLFRLNMLAVAHLNHWAVKRMKARGSGAIVNMSSAVATRPAPYFAAYAASKAFINSLSQALACGSQALWCFCVRGAPARGAHKAERQPAKG